MVDTQISEEQESKEEELETKTLEEETEEILKENPPEIQVKPAGEQLLLEELPAVFEAYIFASEEPLSAKMLHSSLEEQGHEFTKSDVKKVLSDMMSKWSESERPNGQGLELVQVAGGYIFRTHPRWGSVVRTLLKQKPQKMSASQLEILSMVSYRQPVTRIEIEEIRGVDSSSGMRRLLNLRLIKILGKSEGVGRPLLYGTTKYFLELFGLNSLHDLPTLKEYKELGKGADEAQKPKPEDPDSPFGDLTSGEKSQMFSPDTEKLSEEALQDLEKALGAVVSTSKKLDIKKTLEGESEPKTEE